MTKRYFFNYEAETKRNEYPLSLVWARWGWVVVILSPEIKYFLSYNINRLEVFGRKKN